MAFTFFAVLVACLSLSLSWSNVQAIPMQHPHSHQSTSSSSSNLDKIGNSNPSNSELLPHQATSTSNQYSFHPNADNGGSFPLLGYNHPRLNQAVTYSSPKAPSPKKKATLIYDASTGHLVAMSKPDVAPPPPRPSPKIVEPTRPLDLSWKADFPGQICRMIDVIAKYSKVSKTQAFRRLNMKGNHEVARLLLSANQAKQKEGVTKIGYAQKRTGQRTDLLGHQSDEITEKYRNLLGLTRRQAVDKLRKLTPEIAELLKDDKTFHIGASKFQFNHRARPNRRRKLPQFSAEKAPDVSTMMVDAPRTTSPEPSLKTSSLIHPTPIHQEESLLHSSSLSPANDPDDIDFDAVLDWVNRNRSEKGSSSTS